MTEYSDLSKLSPEIQDMYLNATQDYKDIIASIFNPDIQQVDNRERPTPKYAKGTLDRHVFQGGMPKQEKPRRLINTILSGNYRFIEIEGGVRGSKDIYALLGWSRYLMSCPDKVHLALGSSLEHVLRTVLMSDGFGLFFLIPHGIFVRETINGAQRGVYKFLDNYGLEKQILFYGNEKENDKNKFQGFTIGSVYVNETLNQHVEGLLEANNRMASVRQPMMIMTQNPRGKSHPFYMRFEKQRLAVLRDIERMEFVRDTYKDIFDEFEQAILKDRDNEKRKVIQASYKKFSVSKIKELPNDEQLNLNQMMLNINFEFDKIIRNKSVQDFIPDFIESDKDYLYNKSMKKICNYYRGDDNDNMIKNAYDFYYTHFTVDDNLSMSDMQRNDFKNTYAVGTSAYEQSVKGLRRSTDSAVFSMFINHDYLGNPQGNLMSGDSDSDDFRMKYYGSKETFRIMAVDKGLNHPNGIVDVDIDFESGSVYQCEESLLDVKSADVENKGVETIYQEVLNVIRRRRNREMPLAILVDPSAIELYIYLRDKQLPVIKAHNEVWKVRGEESTTANQTQDKDLIGLPLMQTAIAKFKFLVHEKCVYSIEQIGSYEAPFDEKSGKDKVKKVNDDLVDPLRYIFNYYIRMNMWEGENSNVKHNPLSKEKDDRTQTEEKQFSTRELIQQFAGQFPQLEQDELSEGYDSFFGKDEIEFW
jgi:hypothetical protein